MISHHPSHDVLKQFVEGTLPVSVSVIVSAHAEMCSQCQKRIEELTQALAFEAFGPEEREPLAFSDLEMALDDCVSFEETDSGLLEEPSQSLIDFITSESTSRTSNVPSTITEIDVAGERIALPRALRSISLKEWKGYGKVSRARLTLDDDERRTSILHIDKQGHIPSHSHRGFEITLILQGSFEDELGVYHAGDFIWLSAAHTHAPVTREGCVCLTVSDNALHFKQGVSQLVNPFGKFIY
jgi:putative transcriptional regulator